ncbi:unnamed protein product [Amoebophrya sp. A25]|nr:unnamed protein product [Amoebophrya sp. A25]|eukprot:GSA25T00025855001.1
MLKFRDKVLICLSWPLAMPEARTLMHLSPEGPYSSPSSPHGSLSGYPSSPPQPQGKEAPPYVSPYGAGAGQGSPYAPASDGPPYPGDSLAASPSRTPTPALQEGVSTFAEQGETGGGGHGGVAIPEPMEGDDLELLAKGVSSGRGQEPQAPSSPTDAFHSEDDSEAGEKEPEDGQGKRLYDSELEERHGDSKPLTGTGLAGDGAEDDLTKKLEHEKIYRATEKLMLAGSGPGFGGPGAMPPPIRRELLEPGKGFPFMEPGKGFPFRSFGGLRPKIGGEGPPPFKNRAGHDPDLQGPPTGEDKDPPFGFSGAGDSVLPFDVLHRPGVLFGGIGPPPAVGPLLSGDVIKAMREVAENAKVVRNAEEEVAAMTGPPLAMTGPSSEPPPPVSPGGYGEIFGSGECFPPGPLSDEDLAISAKTNDWYQERLAKQKHMYAPMCRKVKEGRRFFVHAFDHRRVFGLRNVALMIYNNLSVTMLGDKPYAAHLLGPYSAAKTVYVNPTADARSLAPLPDGWHYASPKYLAASQMRTNNFESVWQMAVGDRFDLMFLPVEKCDVAIAGTNDINTSMAKNFVTHVRYTQSPYVYDERKNEFKFEPNELLTHVFYHYEIMNQIVRQLEMIVTTARLVVFMDSDEDATPASQISTDWPSLKMDFEPGSQEEKEFRKKAAAFRQAWEPLVKAKARTRKEWRALGLKNVPRGGTVPQQATRRVVLVGTPDERGGSGGGFVPSGALPATPPVPGVKSAGPSAATSFATGPGRAALEVPSASSGATRRVLGPRVGDNSYPGEVPEFLLPGRASRPDVDMSGAADLISETTAAPAQAADSDESSPRVLVPEGTDSFFLGGQMSNFIRVIVANFGPSPSRGPTPSIFHEAEAATENLLVSATVSALSPDGLNAILSASGQSSTGSSQSTAMITALAAAGVAAASKRVEIMMGGLRSGLVGSDDDSAEGLILSALAAMGLPEEAVTLMNIITATTPRLVEGASESSTKGMQAEATQASTGRSADVGLADP